MGQEDEKKSGNASPAAVAAALAVLGLSVGVNVPELLASSSQEQIKSKQMKDSLISAGQKNGSSKNLRLKSRQNKAQLKSKGREIHQGKIESLQNKAGGTLQQKVSPADQSKIPSMQNKAGGIPSLQNKAGGVPE